MTATAATSLAEGLPKGEFNDEEEARSLVDDVLLNTQFDQPEALLRMLIRLNALERHNAVQNALAFMIDAAFARSFAFYNARDAYTGIGDRHLSSVNEIVQPVPTSDA